MSGAGGYPPTAAAWEPRARGTTVVPRSGLQGLAFCSPPHAAEGSATGNGWRNTTSSSVILLPGSDLWGGIPGRGALLREHPGPVSSAYQSPPLRSRSVTVASECV